MKRSLKKVLPALGLCLALTSCAIYPNMAEDGAEWDKSWEMMGQVMGVEPPGDGLVLLENDSVLTGQDTYFATWAVGEPETIINEEDKETDLYDAQLYLLVYGCKDAASSQAAIDEWLATEEQTYDVSERRQETCNGQEYTFLVYSVISETNPFHRGVSAFAVYDTYAVSAELTCVEGFDGDPEQMLKNFLEGCHYSSDLLK